MTRRWLSKSREHVIIIGLFVLAIILFIAVLRFNVSDFGRERKDVVFGVTFSKLQAESLGLDWQKTYLAILDDLKVKLIRLPIYWTDVEPVEGVYTFDDYIWMIEQAKLRNVKIIPVLGMRVPRWPECHVPEWAQESNYELRITNYVNNSHEFETAIDVMSDEHSEYNWYLQSKIIKLLEREVNEFKRFSNIVYWQIENEPLLGVFGVCPFTDQGFLAREFAFVRTLDPRRPLMGTESGEMASWLDLAKLSNVLGVSLYRITFNPYVGFFYYPIPPLFYQKKAELVRHLVGRVIISELQAEPWVETSYTAVDATYLKKRFPLRFMKQNISYARKTQFDVVLLWGVEWWEYMRERGVHEYWEHTKTLF